jgi:hypothetical protein
MQSGGLLSFAGWGITLEWTEEEQRTLEQLMLRYQPTQMDPLQRHVRIAAGLPRKSVRDVALRVRWTHLQHQLKQRTGLDPRRPGIAPMPPKPMLPTAAPMPQLLSPPVADGPPTIEGPIAHLLDANLAILNQFRSNMSAFKVHDNTQLLVQFRDNILNILHLMEAMGGVMAQLPQLPVRLNVDLANNFLPSRPAALAYDGLVMPPPPQPALNAPGMVPLNGLAPGTGTSAGMQARPPHLGPPPLHSHPHPPPSAAKAAGVGPQGSGPMGGAMIPPQRQSSSSQMRQQAHPQSEQQQPSHDESRRQQQILHQAPLPAGEAQGGQYTGALSPAECMTAAPSALKIEGNGASEHPVANGASA